MAEFSFDVNTEIFSKGLSDPNLTIEMVKAGQDVMLNAIKHGAEKHKVTGKMANSLRKAKVTRNKDGDVVGRVKFMGSSGVKVSKNGQRFDATNWIKAFRIEYGTANQRAQPFVRPAIVGAAKEMKAAMQKVFDEKSK